MEKDIFAKFAHLALYNQNVINPIGLLLTISMCLVVLFAKRQYIFPAFIIIACFITSMQRVILFGLDFTMLRIMVVIGFIRIAISEDKHSFKFNRLDRIFILWGIVRTIAHFFQIKTGSALINAAGVSFDTLGIYFIVRYFLYDIEDFDIILKTLVFASGLIALLMLNEQITGRNLFSVFGGVEEITRIREGKLRSQGAFSHAIMAGSFGGSLIPLMWGLWSKKFKTLSVLGMISGITITVTSSSSGPIITLICGIFAIYLWKFRQNVKKMVWGLYFILAILHVVMKTPVWHLISRIDLVGGSTGYHRYILIDSAIRRFPEWFLVGVSSTAHWGWGLADLTNMYIVEGTYGGFFTLVLFILGIVYSFKSVGLALTRLKGRNGLQKYIWALGAVLFAHVISFFGVSYFGQMIFFYFLLLAMISSLNNFPTILNKKLEVKKSKARVISRHILPPKNTSYF